MMKLSFLSQSLNATTRIYNPILLSCNILKENNQTRISYLRISQKCMRELMVNYSTESSFTIV